MGRLLQILIPIVLMTAAIAGCIGGDEEPVADGDGNADGDPVDGNVTDGNETVEAPLPEADIGVQMAIGDNASADPPFVAPAGADLTFTLDGSGSTVDNGSIEVYSWSVIRPGGAEEQATTGSDPSYAFMVNGTSNPDDFGVYTATLRVMTDQQQLGLASIQFAVSFNHTYTFANTMVGPGLVDCDGFQQEGGGPLPSTDIVLGTYRTHSLTLGPNATSIDLSFDFATEDTMTQMKVYLYPAGVEVTGDTLSAEDSNCGEAMAESEAGEGPLSVAASDLGITSRSSFEIRVQMIGLSVSGYSLAADVGYEVPGGSNGDDGGENGDE